MHAQANIWHSSLFVFSAHHFQRSHSSRCTHWRTVHSRVHSSHGTSPFHCTFQHLPAGELQIALTFSLRNIFVPHSTGLIPRYQRAAAHTLSTECVPGQADSSTETWEKDGNNATRSPRSQDHHCPLSLFFVLRSPSHSSLLRTSLPCVRVLNSLDALCLASLPRCERLFVR